MGLLQRTISTLQHEFSMKDLGQLHHFLGMQVQHTPSGLFLSQRQYMIDILDRAGMYVQLQALLHSCGYESKTLC